MLVLGELSHIRYPATSGSWKSRDNKKLKRQTRFIVDGKGGYLLDRQVGSGMSKSLGRAKLNKRSLWVRPVNLEKIQVKDF